MVEVLNYNTLEIMGICFLILISTIVLVIVGFILFIVYINISAKNEHKYNMKNLSTLISKGDIDLSFKRKNENGDNIVEKVDDMNKKVDEILNEEQNKKQEKSDEVKKHKFFKITMFNMDGSEEKYMHVEHDGATLKEVHDKINSEYDRFKYVGIGVDISDGNTDNMSTFEAK